jgi:hypothetical protein
MSGQAKTAVLLGMTLPYVAALTHPDIQVEIKDDMLEEIDWRANRRFYSPLSFIRRLTTHLYSWQMLPFNLYFSWCVRRRIQPLDYF